MNLADWKLRLRIWKIKTPFQHYTIMLDGKVTEEMNLDCPIGNAWMSVKVWALDDDMAGDMACYIADDIGFKVKDSEHSVLIYDTEPKQPPRDKPYGYDINFHPYSDDE